MQFKVFGQNGRNLTRSAAILVIGALSAGCSSSAMRFDDLTDGLFTGSTHSQRQSVATADNPFPGDVRPSAPVSGAAPQPVMQQAAVSPGLTNPVRRSELPPVAGSAVAPAGTGLLPAPSRPASTPSAAPLPAVASSAPVQDRPASQPQVSQPRMASAEISGGTGGYTVVAGDTLFGIAKKTGVSAEKIRQANGLSDGFLRIGQRLQIPSAGGQQVVSAPANVDQANTASVGPANNPQAPSAEPAAYTPPANSGKLVEQAALNPSGEAPDSTGIGRMRWPVRGRVIAGYGSSGAGKTNDGIDIAVPEGTPVKAAENGVVIYAGDGLKEFGNTVLVRHEDGLVTVYGHASEIKVARGDTVRRGQEIASSGMSGKAETPKLHFEVRKDSAPVDPTKFLE